MTRSEQKEFYAALAIGILAVGVRLTAINQPFVDDWSWRQSDVAAIARNFFQGGFHFAYPQIDWAGNSGGYVGTEFPILPFAAALLYQFTGVHEWIGRGESVIFFASSLPFFFVLVRRIFGAATAIYALIFFAFAPLNIAAGRSFIPDVPSLSLSIIGCYFFLRWIEEDEVKHWWLASLALAFAFLIKLPSAIIGLPLLYLAWEKFAARLFRQKRLWFFAVLTLLPSAAWYWHAHRVAEIYYPFHFFGAGGFEIKGLGWYWRIAVRTFTSGLTPILSLAAAGGCFFTPKVKFGRFFQWWFVAMLLFILCVGYGNRHPWYQLPLVPLLAVFAGSLCRRFSPKFSGIILVAFGVSAFLYAKPFFKASANPLRDLGLELRNKTPADALIVAADDGDPTIFYYAERKGWHFLEDGIYIGNPLESAQAIANLEKLKARGANYFVLYFGTLWWLDSYDDFGEYLRNNSELIEATPEFAIYRLKP